MRLMIPVLVAAGVGAALVANRRVAPMTACDQVPAGRLAPSRDLYCVELVPAPGLEGVEGRVALTFEESPFTHAVTADGRTRYRASFILSDLPNPESLGPYSRYVAWVATPVLHPIRRLGEVTNGTVTLGPVEFDKFVLLITAEPDDSTVERQGRLVLRGQSASTRMTPPDILEFSLGAGGMAWGDDGGPPSRDAWPLPPMPRGVAMLPAMREFRPRVSPWLPESGPDVPPVRPQTVHTLQDGDTLMLEAGPVSRVLRGRTVTMLGFNGQHPGPLLDVPQAATVHIDFRNNTTWPTTVHWHGIRLDNRFDGVPGVTQAPVPPGGRFLYSVFFKDAGIYWYHPHQREDVQQDLGLYGNMLVRSSMPHYYGPAHREALLVLDDLLLGPEGLVPFGFESASHTLMGRFGNVFLVNGEPDYSLEVGRGEVVRFFLTNVSNTRTFNLSFPGARMKVLGSDVGRFEREAWVESVIIAPAERYVIHARFDTPGAIPIVNQVQAIDHLNGTFVPQVDTLGTVQVSATAVGEDLASSFGRLREHRRVGATVDSLRRMADGPPDHRLVLTMETEDLPFIMDRLMRLDSAYFHPVEWSGTMPMMNWSTSPEQVHWIMRDPDTGLENMAIDWRFQVGDVVKVRLANERTVLHGMQHPIHLHGQRFLVLSLNGVPNGNLVWKDTVLLPVGTTADILVEMSNPGRWVIHCHIAEHLESGMHMVFTVDEP